VLFNQYLSFYDSIGFLAGGDIPALLIQILTAQTREEEKEEPWFQEQKP
jgi:hypothetical protein